MLILRFQAVEMSHSDGHWQLARTRRVVCRSVVQFDSSDPDLVLLSPPERSARQLPVSRIRPKESHGHTQGRQVPTQESTDPSTAPPPGHVAARGSDPAPKGPDQVGSLSRSLDTVVQYLFRHRWDRPQLRSYPECRTHSSKSHRHVQRIPQWVPPRAPSRTSAISGSYSCHRDHRSVVSWV